jgi:FSR family fosmidomycin resistance protein-like MFS transporter
MDHTTAMKPSTLRLVLLLSCCHALVHVYELSFASVEQLVAEEFGVDTAVTGWLGFCLRLPFGLCAFAAGWLADRFGAKRLLLVYLCGSSAAALLARLAPSLGLMFGAMFTLGTFASIYHPAGVGLISHVTRPENRPMALGYHGILGSAGIAAGPFLASLVLATGSSWRHYYLVLAIPGVLLAALLMLRFPHRHDPASTFHPQSPSNDQEQARWDCYFLLITAAVTAGFVYAAVMTFMPRYLAGAGWDAKATLERIFHAIGRDGATLRPASVGNFLTALVLLLGVLGQYASGRAARPTTLEPLMAFSFFATVPCLLWMGFATGLTRVCAAAVFAPFFFMHQPLFNSLVAKYVPRRRRSLAYGLSFTIGFGIGGTGAAFAGQVQSALGAMGPLVNYGTLAVLALLAGSLALVLWRRNRATSRAFIGAPEARDEQPAEMLGKGPLG